MAKLEYHNLSDGLAVYKQKRSKNYYIYLNTAGGQFRRTLGTPDLKKATKKAWHYYFAYTENITPEIFESSKKSTVKYICDHLVDLLLKKHEETGKAKSQAKEHARILRDAISPAFGNLKIKQLDRGRMRPFMDDYCTNKTKLQNTKKTFAHIFDYAVENGLMKEFEVPTVPTSDNVQASEERAIFDPSHLSGFWSDYRGFIGASRNFKTRQRRIVLRHYMTFLLETGLRPGEEAVNIQLKDFELDWLSRNGGQDKEEGYFCVNVRAGKIHSKNKTGFRKVPITLKALEAVDAIMHELWGEEDSLFISQATYPDLYIFRPKYMQALETTPAHEKTFEQLCKFAGVDKDENFYSLYSCRHTYITNMLKKGTDVYLLATNCGTSVEMIQRYYSKLETNMRASELI